MTNKEVIDFLKSEREAIQQLANTCNADQTDYFKKHAEAYDIAIEALEQNAKLKEAIEKMDEWVHSGNRGNCDYFIVDQVEEIINGLKKNGTVSK